MFFLLVSSAVKFDCGRFIYVITFVYMVAYPWRFEVRPLCDRSLFAALQ
jgi:hypothetical protein